MQASRGAGYCRLPRMLALLALFAGGCHWLLPYHSAGVDARADREPHNDRVDAAGGDAAVADPPFEVHSVAYTGSDLVSTTQWSQIAQLRFTGLPLGSYLVLFNAPHVTVQPGERLWFSIERDGQIASGGMDGPTNSPQQHRSMTLVGLSEITAATDVVRVDWGNGVGRLDGLAGASLVAVRISSRTQSARAALRSTTSAAWQFLDIGPLQVDSRGEPWLLILSTPDRWNSTARAESSHRVEIDAAPLASATAAANGPSARSPMTILSVARLEAGTHVISAGWRAAAGTNTLGAYNPAWLIALPLPSSTQFSARNVLGNWTGSSATPGRIADLAPLTLRRGLWLSMLCAGGVQLTGTVTLALHASPLTPVTSRLSSDFDGQALPGVIASTFQLQNDAVVTGESAVEPNATLGVSGPINEGGAPTWLIAVPSTR